ncbi:serine/arginine repetitive matrix protein 2-like isoform X1 [Branchiostoma floridae]|uniref:Serine/arginine repetitive matrix protein 2-like isoform X1 n=2 Tax=Branchiostoma floridae TaxID=7739 RepID=A0A9J7LSF4_BRAFL|nr:serine/arginine repetitive matrix protein 2-like isoform X1 [Branchiostoma floridae]
MRGRQTAKQAAVDDGESRGRRKLDFAASSSSKTPQPLAGKVFFLDLRGYGALNIKKLESNIVLLGGSVVNFFDKDVGVTHVISNQDGAKKDTPSGPADSPAASTPSPFSAATSVRRSSRGNLQSPAVDSPSNAGSSSAVSRGKAIARKAMDTQKQGSSNVLSIAKQLKLKVKHIDVAAQWIEEQAVKLKKAGVKRPQKPAQASENVSKARKLKPPFVKFEDSSQQYRPVYEELPKFPRVNVDTPSGTCPFDGGAYQDVPVAERSKEEASRAEEGEGGTGKKSEQRKEENTRRSSPRKKVQHKASLAKKAATSQSRSKPSALKVKKNAGYCECCMLKYNDLQQHIKGDQHRAFVKRQENYISLDRRIRKGPVLDRFLKDVMKYHPIDKTRALQSPGWPEDTDTGDQGEPEEQDNGSDDVILISDPAPVVAAPRWPTPAMCKIGMVDPSVISSLRSLSQHSGPTKPDQRDRGEGASSASSLHNLSDSEDEEERRKRKHKKKMAKVTTPQKVFGSSPEKRFPALDRLVTSVENKMEKRKSSDQGSQCSAPKRQRVEVCDSSPERGKKTEKAKKSPKPTQKNFQRLQEEDEEGNERQHRDEEHTLQDAEPNCEQKAAQDRTFKASNTPSPSNVRPRRSPGERNLGTLEQSQEKVEHSGHEVRRSGKKSKQKHDSDMSDHKEQAPAKQIDSEVGQSRLLVTPEKRLSLVEIQATPIRGTDELERRQKELVRSPSPVISPETRQSLPKDNTTAVFSSSVSTSTPLRTLKQRTETVETLPQRKSPRSSTQPKLKPAQEPTKREPGRKALRKTKHLENSPDRSPSVHRHNLNSQAPPSDQCAALLMTSELSGAEFLGFDLTVSEADRIWQQASGVDASRRALFEESSDKSEIFEIDIGAFQSEGSDWDKPVTGFISAELSRKVSVSTAVFSPRDSDKENQEDGARQRLNSSGGKNFYTTDLSGNLLSDVRLRRLELERRFTQGRLSQTRSFCEIAGLPPLPEPPPVQEKDATPPELEIVGKTPEAKETNHRCGDKPPPLDLLDHIEQPLVQPGPSRTVAKRSKGKSPKYILEGEEVGLEDVESVGWSDCDKSEVQDFRLKVRNPQTNEVHILKAAKPIQLQDPFYIMSAPTTQPDQGGNRGYCETGPMSPGVSPKGKFKYKPSPKKVLRYKSKEVLLKSPVKNAYSRPAAEFPESAVRRIMDDLGFQEAATVLQEGFGYQGTPRRNRRLSEVGLTNVEYDNLIDSVINSPRWNSESQLGVSMSSNIDALDLLDDWDKLISEDTSDALSSSDLVASFDPTMSHEDPTVSSEDPTVSHEDPTVSNEDPTVSHEDPTVSNEDPTVSHEDPTVSNEDPTVSRDCPAVSHGDPVGSQDPTTREKQRRKAPARRYSSSRSDDGIWEKLQRWVSEGSSEGSNPYVKTKDVGTSPVRLTVPEMQELSKQSLRSPRRSGKSGKQKKQSPNQSQVDSNKPTNSLSQKPCRTSPNTKVENASRIQILKQKYMNRNRPSARPHYNSTHGRYRKNLKLPIRRRPAQRTRKEKPVKEKPTKKPTRRSPRVILHRLNLQTVQTTAAGDLVVQPVQNEPVGAGQAGKQTNQTAQRKRRRRKPGPAPKQDINKAGTQTTQGGQKVIKRKPGRPPKVRGNVASTQTVQGKVPGVHMASTQANQAGQKVVKRKPGRPRTRPRKEDVNMQHVQSSPSPMIPAGKSIPIQSTQNNPSQRISAGKSPSVSTAQQPELVLNRSTPVQSAQNNPSQMKPVGKSMPVQSTVNSPRQRNSVGKSPPVSTAQQSQMKPVGKSTPVQSTVNSPRQRNSVGKSPPVSTAQQSQMKPIGKSMPVQSTMNSPRQRNSVGKSPPVSTAQQSQTVLSRKNLDIPSSPDTVPSPQRMTPKRKGMDSPDTWTSPRKKSTLPTSPEPSVGKTSSIPASPEPSIEKKKETPSPGVRRGRGLKKSIPECRNK